MPSDQKGYILSNPPYVNFRYKRATQRSMGWKNLIIVSNELHSVEKSYVNVVSAIATFVEPVPPTNIITNETILTKYNIKYGLKVYGKKSEDVV